MIFFEQLARMSKTRNTLSFFLLLLNFFDAGHAASHDQVFPSVSGSGEVQESAGKNILEDRQLNRLRKPRREALMITDGSKGIARSKRSGWDVGSKYVWQMTKSRLQHECCHERCYHEEIEEYHENLKDEVVHEWRCEIKYAGCARKESRKFFKENLDCCRDVNCNDGTCLRLERNYICICKKGFSGEHCETPDVSNRGKKCWHNCNKTAGRCDWCNKGSCCRRGWKADGCNMANGCQGKHCCDDTALTEVVIDLKWRGDSKCGQYHRIVDKHDQYLKYPVRAGCNPYGDKPCCSKYGWCGNTNSDLRPATTHCACLMCVDYRKTFKTKGTYVAGRDGFSYKLHKEKLNWYQAFDVCRAEGAELAMTKSQATYDYVTETFRGEVWLGLMDGWVGLRQGSREGKFVNSDWTYTKLTAWGPGEPRNDRTYPSMPTEEYVYYRIDRKKDRFLTKDCVEKRTDGRWYTKICHDKIPFLCQKKTPAKTTTTTTMTETTTSSETTLEPPH